MIDWGLAKVIGEADDDDRDASSQLAADSLQTQIGLVFGTPGFMAPEQVRGEELGTRGDVYALGATLYHLLARKPPHAGNERDRGARPHASTTRSAPLARRARPARRPSSSRSSTRRSRSMPADALPDAAALAEDLQRFPTGQLVAAHRYTPRERLARFAKRHRARARASRRSRWSRSRCSRGRRAPDRRRARSSPTRPRAATRSRTNAPPRTRAIVEAGTPTSAASSPRPRALVSTNPTEASRCSRAVSSRLEDARRGARDRARRRSCAAWRGRCRPPMRCRSRSSCRRTRVVLFVSSLDDGMVRVFDLDARRLMLAKHGSRTHARGRGSTTASVCSSRPRRHRPSSSIPRPAPSSRSRCPRSSSRWCRRRRVIA